MKATRQRRFESIHAIKPDNVLEASADIIRERRTMFPSTVVKAEDSPRLLVSGMNSRKIGRMVTKGAWAGMPIYTLTLEERATCPQHCHLLKACYGNSSPFSRRHRHGHAFEMKLVDEVAALAWKHRKGFVVRLHVLGDFYSARYVRIWNELLERVQNLHVFGYTARCLDRDTEIAMAVVEMNAAHFERCFIRFSSDVARSCGTTVINHMPITPRVKEGIVCPVETERTSCCATCGLCWAEAARNETIVFIRHGNRPGRRKNPPFPVRHIPVEAYR